MKRVYFLLIFTLFVFHLRAGIYDIVPKPSSITTTDATLICNKSITVYADKVVDRGYLTEILKDMGFEPTFVEASNQAYLVLALNANKQGQAEGYQLSVTNTGKNNIQVNADAKAGLLYAMQSLRQLAVLQSNGNVSIPCCTIKDAPAFKWRAFMLDESRHFQGMETVKRLLGEMARLKMNTFHWHLVDEPGWRIEIKKYPKLTKIGSKRDYSHREITPSGWDSIHSKRAYYTQNEIREIVKYADARGIRIIPEIEMPAHASAAIASYPWLGTISSKQKKAVWSDLYKVSDKRVIKFLRDVMDEVISLFPSKIIHVGGDEANYSIWKGSEEINKFMKSNNISTYADLQLWAINNMSNYLASKGCHMIGWNEITGDNIRNEANNDTSKSQKLADGTIVQFWDGDISLVNKAIAKGYDVVNSDHVYTYLDYPYNVTPLEKAYSFNPIPKGLSDEEKSKILGSGCQMWGEFTPNLTRLYYQIFPRLGAYAECFWTSPDKKDYADFCERMTKIERRWRQLGYFNTQPSFTKQSDTFTLWQLPTQINTIGNSYVIKTDNGQVLVVDGGVKEEEGYLRGFLAAMGNTVDCWFVTHPHDDHVGALTKILENPNGIAIRQICQSTFTEALLNTEPTYKPYAVEYYNAVKKDGIPCVEGSLGMVMKFGNTTVKILGIKNEDLCTDYNNSSMVFKVSDPVKSVLFLGDAGEKEGEKLLNSPYKKDLDCDYMQMAHHGQNGVSMDFYRTVKFRACLWPTPSWVYNNDIGKGFNTHNLKTIETRKTVDELGITEQYVSYQGLAKIE